MAPPFVMTTEQWVTDPVEEFNLPGGPVGHGLANIARRRGWRSNALVAAAGPHDPPARTRETDPPHPGELRARARRAS